MPFPKELWAQVAQASGKDLTTSYLLSTLMALSRQLLSSSNYKINQHPPLHPKQATLSKTISSA
jgi:hypothetical protein